MFTTRPELIGTFGMVASTQWLASSAGMAILEKGGNAFDAAAAAGFVLQVVEPHLNGPGGDLPILFYSAEKHKVMVICGQGVAPAGATIERYRALDLDLVPGSGLLAATVPGAFDAWLLMLQEFGTLSLSDVIAPAIHYARDGYPLMPGICATIDIVSDLFRDEWPSSAALYLQNGAPPTAGTLFRNPDLAATYDRIVRESEAGRGDREMQIQTARRLFYRGFIAETIGEFCRGNEFMDTSGQRHRGFLTADDLATWQATIEEPLSYDYHGYTVYKTDSWGQGPVFLQQLALLKNIDLESLDPFGSEFVHTVLECAKLAFADREAFYGDPNFVQVPMDQLLSDAYNDTRRGLIDSQASQELRPGDIPGFGATPINRVAKPDVAPRGAAVLGVAEDTTARYGGMRGDTCHLDVIDRAGNMVSATPSGGWLQSSPVIPGLGFALGTRAQMFWLQEGMPTSLAPGARPRTTLTPSLASRDSEPYMAFGTPGEDKQDQWSLTFFLRHVHFDMNLQEAIDAPMFHSSHFPGSFYPRESYPGRVAIEGRFSQDTIAELRRRGHDVQVENDWCLGRLSAVAKDGVLLKAAANPRYMQGYAVGR
jgi:gamma-glutamyltranspeptidase/glutathione hydrolase